MSYPIDPVALQLGPVQIQWYGLMYLFAFLVAWGLLRFRAVRRPWSGQGWKGEQVNDLLTWGMLGVILGGRLGYMLFYNAETLLSDPLEVIRIWNGGMSFHGGLVGVLLAVFFWSRRQGHTFLEVLDFVAPAVPPGLMFGRFGNFINSELWGRVTDMPWGMVFPFAGPYPRHPSQLYEAFLEGPLLFVILWIFSAGGGEQGRKRGRTAGLFALLYGLFRFAVEFVREPDAHLGFLAFGWLTMGQVLCLPLLVVGLWLLLRPSVFPSPE